LRRVLRLLALTDIFKKVDADGGGTLDLEELTEALGKELADQTMAKLDADGDGELSLEEFVDGAPDAFGAELDAKIAEFKGKVGL